MKISPSLLSAPLLRMALASLSAASALALPFTYQGRLVDGAALGNGNYELRFRLFDSVTAGSQVGGELLLPVVGVTNGLFTVELDFGTAAFPGDGRWLELAARPAGTVEPPEILSPRQAINAVPYALRAFAGPGNATELTSGTLPDARLSGNIPRVGDLNTLSNTLTARLTALEAALVTVSNRLAGLPPAGTAAVSPDPADATLVGQGWVRFSSVPAPSWIAGSSAESPSGRTGHATAWNGQSLLVWGGNVGAGVLSATGAAYDPAADQWTPISPLNAPAARQGPAAVWAGTQLLIWGGLGTGGFLGTGAAYAPGTGNWSPLPVLNAPAPRSGQVSAWTGSRLLVWGGRNQTGALADGGLYDPQAGAWSTLPVSGAPEARFGATGVWTGVDFIVWGGQGALGELGTGARLPIPGGQAPGNWAAVSAVGAPAARSGHTAVWTGTQLLVWGGQQGGTPLGSGAAYDPVANTWTALPGGGAPTARSGHVAAWTGAEMLVWGGQGASGPVATGGAYNPQSGQWRPLSAVGGPLARSGSAAAWTGTELMVFGGSSGATPTAALQRLNPQPSWHFFRKP